MANVQVFIVGAGSTGLTLACDLARRGVKFRIVDASFKPFEGSRGKGLQPRTLEVFDDLGVIDPVLDSGSLYPHFLVHMGPIALRVGPLSKYREPTPDVPFPNLWMIPQSRTVELLRARLAELGGAVEDGASVTNFGQDEHGVTIEVAGQSIRTDYLIGCDGGHSLVRKLLGVPLVGDTIEGPPVLVADLEIDGLDRTYWHAWPWAKGYPLNLCPLPGSNLFQMQIPLSKKAAEPDLSAAGIGRLVAQASRGKLTVKAVAWASLYRPQVRMATKYRVGRVFVCGDAAHVHPPAGGQGLNTGVQDAYNLGWKLSQVLDGAPPRLLDTYEAERLPVAASVLKLSKRLYLKNSLRRGKETNQLDINYGGETLAVDLRPLANGVRAGDRLPDAVGADATGKPMRLFGVLRGPQFTLLLWNFEPLKIALPDGIRVVRVVDRVEQATVEEFVDNAGQLRAIFRAVANTFVLVRPDGYIGLIGTDNREAALADYLALVMPG
jgi:2-polyprenyl-6-methoxyphenol hydroxylase-like FAD-dependent oxidoreductase